MVTKEFLQSEVEGIIKQIEEKQKIFAETQSFLIQAEAVVRSYQMLISKFDNEPVEIEVKKD